MTGLVCSLKDSRIHTVCDDPNLLCPIVVTVVSALCLLFKKGGEVEVHDKDKGSANEKGSGQREKV